MAMSDQNDFGGYNVAKLKGKLENEELPALREAGLIPPDKIDYLESYKESYEPYQAEHYNDSDKEAYYYFNSKKYVRLVRRYVGKTLSKAVENGNWSIIQHAVGLAEDEREDMDFVEYKRFEQQCELDGMMFNILGPRGGGKSNFFYRWIEFLLEKYDDAVFAVNEPSVAELHERLTHVTTDKEVILWALNHQGMEKWVFLDEMTSKFSARNTSFYDAEVAHELGTKFRKKPLNLNWVNVYHEPDDPPPTWREGDSAVFIRKEGNTRLQTQKTAVFYGSCNSGKLENPMFELYGIKENELGYDTDVNPDWDWELEEDEFEDMINNPHKYVKEEEDGPEEEYFEDDYEFGENEDESDIRTVLKLRKKGMSLDEIADITETPKSTVSYWVRKHMDEN